MNGDIDRDILKNSFEDIRFSKKQQWHVIYLVLLAIGAIIALVLKFNNDDLLNASFTVSISSLLFAGVLIITGVGVYFMWSYADDIRKYRKKKDELLKNMDRKEQDKPKKPNRDINIITSLFSLVIIFAAVIAILLILKSNPEKRKEPPSLTNPVSSTQEIKRPAASFTGGDAYGSMFTVMGIVGGIIGAIGGSIGIYSFFEKRWKEKEQWDVFFEVLPTLMTRKSSWVPDDPKFNKLAEELVERGKLKRITIGEQFGYVLPEDD